MFSGSTVQVLAVLAVALAATAVVLRSLDRRAGKPADRPSEAQAAELAAAVRRLLDNDADGLGARSESEEGLWALLFSLGHAVSGETIEEWTDYEFHAVRIWAVASIGGAGFTTGARSRPPRWRRGH